MSPWLPGPCWLLSHLSASRTLRSLSCTHRGMRKPFPQSPSLASGVLWDTVAGTAELNSARCVCLAQQHGVAVPGAGNSSPDLQAGLGQHQGCSAADSEHSCTHSELGRPFRMVWINKHRIKDNADLYSILVELLQSLPKHPSRGKSTVQNQPSKVESTRSCCRLRS